MRVGIFGPKLYRTTIIVKNTDQYNVFEKIINEASKGIKHVDVEEYNNCDVYVISLTFPLMSKFHTRMMNSLHERGFNLAQLGQGGIHLMIDESK